MGKGGDSFDWERERGERQKKIGGANQIESQNGLKDEGGGVGDPHPLPWMG